MTPGPTSPANWRASSLWASGSSPVLSSSDTDRTADVVVVGAGIAGLLTAALLEARGATVIVVDRHGPGGVATRNTTAKVTALQGTIYRTIRRTRGAEIAAQYAAAQRHAVTRIADLADALNIECALTRAPAYTYATEAAAGDQAHEELEAAGAAGLAVEWVTGTELPFPVVGAVRLDDQLHFHPLRFTAGLARHLGPDRVLSGVAVTAIDERNDGCEVHTDGGATLHADHVIIATQGPIVDPALLADRCTPVQSYAIAATTATPLFEGMYLSCDEETRSLRPAEIDGEHHVVVGGGSHRTGSDADTRYWDDLESWTAEHFGPLPVTHRWAIHDLVPTDHVPFIGPLSAKSQRRWVAAGFAKWGMTNGYVAAHLITEAIDGRDVAWSPAFDPTRVFASINREAVTDAFTAARHLIGDRITRRPEPRCTHQGCVLRHDGALDTWACPCHGSRFELDGAVTQGPASAPLDLD